MVITIGSVLEIVGNTSLKHACCWPRGLGAQSPRPSQSSGLEVSGTRVAMAGRWIKVMIKNDGWAVTVRVSPVTLRLGSEMDPCQRDLTNILLSYLILDSFGPVLGARAWSCKTTEQLPRLITAPEYLGNLWREMFQVATRTFNVLYYFPFIWFNGSHYPRSYI